MALSRTQVDRLGERLRRGDVSDAELRLLDAYRRSFAEPFATVFAVLRDEMGLAPTGRSAKSTKSIIDKLNRESARLSQVQDIAGCRVVVADIGGQDRTVEALVRRFGTATVIDRRTRPSNGYRAVHVLVPVEDRRVEVQVRTSLQQLWAELSEKLSDRFGIAVKYGGGDSGTRTTLNLTSALVADVEGLGEDLTAPVLTSDFVTIHPDLAAQVARLHDARRLHFDRTRALLQEAIARLTDPGP